MTSHAAHPSAVGGGTPPLPPPSSPRHYVLPPPSNAPQAPEQLIPVPETGLVDVLLCSHRHALILFNQAVKVASSEGHAVAAGWLCRKAAEALACRILTSTTVSQSRDAFTLCIHCSIHSVQAVAQGNTHAMELLAASLAVDIRLHAQVPAVVPCTTTLRHPSPPHWQGQLGKMVLAATFQPLPLCWQHRGPPSPPRKPHVRAWRAGSDGCAVPAAGEAVRRCGRRPGGLTTGTATGHRARCARGAVPAQSLSFPAELWST